MSSLIKKASILVTSVGRRVELVHAFRRAFLRLGLEGSIIGTDIEPLAPGLQEVDQPYIVPRISDPAYIPTLIEICRREAVDVIFPLIDPDIPILAASRSTFEEVGTHVAVVAPEVASLTADKWLTTAFFQSLQLPVPNSWLPDTIPLTQLQYPVFIKPRQGSAAKFTFKVENPTQLAFFMDYVPNPIIQEYLPGPEITNDVICNLDGDVLGVVSRRRIEVRWGEVAKGVTMYDPRITEACLQIANSLSPTGPITVQCILKDDVPHFTEINARIGGGAPLAIAAGADFPSWLLSQIYNVPLEIPPIGSYQTGLYLSRHDKSHYIKEDALNEMASRHI